MSIFDTSEFNNSPFDIMLNKGYHHIQPSSRFDPFQTPSSDLLRKESLSMIDKLQNQQQYSNINRTYNFNDVSNNNNTFNGISNINNPSSLNGLPNNTALNTNLSNGLSNGGTPTSLSNGHSNGLPAGIPRPPNKHFPSWSSGETSQNSFQYMAASPPVTSQNHTFQPTSTQNSNHMPGSLHSLSTSPLNGYSSPLFLDDDSPDLSFLSSKSRLNSYINSSPPSSLPAAGLIPQIESMKVSIHSQFHFLFCSSIG